ncbi:MAG: anti-sigma factor domain-containing protein [Bacillota bacterium]
MKNNQLIIMSIDKNYTVGYSADGQFIKIPKNSSHKVGQIINYQRTKTGLRKPWGMAIAAAILLMFFTGLLNPFFTEEAAAAYLSMGLTTGSLEIWTNDNNRVIKTNYTSTLEDLKQHDLEGKDIYEAMSVLALEAKKSGLITENENDILLIDLIDLKESTNHYISEDKLKKVILEGFAVKEYQGLMMMERHDKDFLRKANELNLTASQYHIYQASSSKGYNIEMEQIQHGHIRNILKENGTSPEEIFGMHSKIIPNNTERMPSQQNTTNMHNNEINSSNQNNNIVAPEHNRENIMNQDTDNHEDTKMPMNNYDKMHN